MLRQCVPVGLALTLAASAAAQTAPARTPGAMVVTIPAPPQPRSGVLIPLATTMKALTPPEVEANAVWNLRAGLNVAALQCQYSRFLATVKTYNDLLKDHSAELAKAQATMMAHFKRHDGSRALNSFDQYTTKTYNSYSTLDAQYAFCQASSEVGRGALFVQKGALGKFAVVQTPVLRASLTPSVANFPLGVIDVQPVPLPPVEG